MDEKADVSILETGDGVVPRIKLGEQERFAPFCAASEHGGVDILVAEWNDEFFQELESFDGGKKRRHDDIVDSCADGYMMLATTTQIPVFSMPDLKATTPYDFAS